MSKKQGTSSVATKAKPKFKIIHSSSRYDRSISSLRQAVERYLTADASVHTGTEVSTKERSRAVRETAQALGWGSTMSNRSYRDDCYILWDSQVWKVVGKGSRVIKTGHIFNFRGGKMPNNTMTYAALSHRQSDHVMVLGVLHLPASVETASGVSNSRRGSAWRTEAKNTRKTMNELGRKYKADALVFGGDWNVNIKRGLLRGAVTKIFGRWKIAAEGPFSKGGTHGGRFIDFFIYKRGIKYVGHRLMKDDASSDHRPFKTEFKFKKKSRIRRRSRKKHTL